MDSRSLPNVMCFRGCISRSAVKSSIVLEATHPITSRLPPGFCSTASSTTLWTEWIPALSPTWWNVQTRTKSFVDKRRPWQNRVPDWHVGNKLSFQVNWMLWINSIALSSSDHPSSIQNHLCWVHSNGGLCTPWFSSNPNSQDLRREGHVQQALVSSSLGNDLL